jgi:putative ABC transport system permease protein
MVLLLACLNVANVLLARNARRRHEIAVRAALGASRLRLIRQLLVESLIIACLGGGLGLLCAPLGIHLLRAVAPPKLPRLDNVGIDGWVLAFTLRLSIVTGILVGMLPAIQGSRAHLFMSLKEERGSSPATSGLAPLHRMQSGLTAYQVALATILLVGAGLVVRSFARLMSVDLGFDPHNLLTVWLSETSLGNLGEEAVLSFYNRTLEEVRALPGVEAVALGGIPPVGGGWTGTFIDVEGTSGNVTASRVDVQWQDVSPAYFTTMRIRILKGRGFTSDHDRHVVVINQAAARRFWPNANPVGRRIHMGLGRGWCEIVGVAADARDISLDRQPTPQVYSVLRLGSLQTTLLVRTISRPQALANAVLNRIWYVDKDERVLAVTPMENVISKSVVGPRFHVALLSLFALLALLMAGIGVYGVVACSVSQRTHEIGVRLALGARRRDVFALVVGQQLAMTILGVALGLGIAFALTRTLASLLYDVRPTDPVAFAGASVLLIVSALLASFIPARRATKVDPMVALRYE